MKKLIVCAATLSVLAVTSAVAADMPMKAPVYKAPVVVPPSWTGWYAGLSVGYGWGSEHNTFNFDPAVPLPFDNVTYHDKLNGFIGGGQIGYNYQITPNSWVAGVEADISYANFRGSDSNSGVTPGGGPNIRFIGGVPWTYNQDQKVNWLATLRGRLGWTPGDHTWLIYATGGLAVGGVKASDTFTFGSGAGALIWTGDSSETRAGWTVGGGVEARLMDNWSAKLEYLYYDLGHLTVVGNPSTPLAFTTTTDFAFRGNIVRVGLNKRFTSN
jgi:outer membrane immunogenic protein